MDVSYGITVGLIRRSCGASLQLIILGKSVLFTEKYLEPSGRRKMNDLLFLLSIKVAISSFVSRYMLQTID